MVFGNWTVRGYDVSECGARHLVAEGINQRGGGTNPSLPRE